MAAGPDHPPIVIALVGETGSGKSALAIDLALQFNGEIIAADSRTIYTGMDIGTAKPSPEDQARVRHHLIDVVTPDEVFSAAAFKQQADAAISDISRRGKIAFLVGGTGLYVDAVMYNFSFRPASDPTRRAEFEDKTVAELQTLLTARRITLPENARNPRHLIRALETGGQAPDRQPLGDKKLILGLTIDRPTLQNNIRNRIEKMLDAGLLKEVAYLADQYGWDSPGMQAPGYKTFYDYFEGRMTFDAAKASFVQEHLHLAKRQRTWFRRNSDIYSICKKEEAVELITTLLNKSYTASD